MAPIQLKAYIPYNSGVNQVLWVLDSTQPGLQLLVRLHCCHLQQQLHRHCVHGEVQWSNL